MYSILVDRSPSRKIDLSRWHSTLVSSQRIYQRVEESLSLFRAK